MKNFLVGIAIGLLVFYVIFKYQELKEDVSITSTNLIEKRIKNVSELIVTEGHFSDVITYKDAKKYYVDWFSSEKKAVVLVKAKATLSYDLKELAYFFDKSSNTIIVTHIPEVDLNVYPTLEYYDVEQGYLNSFEAEDYNKIDKEVRKKLRNQIEQSDFKINAENRLISELFFLLNKDQERQVNIIMEDKEDTLEKLIE